MTAALIDPGLDSADLTSPENVAAARTAIRLHFPDATRPGTCFRCRKPFECDTARWAAGILALVEEST